MVFGVGKFINDIRFDVQYHVAGNANIFKQYHVAGNATIFRRENKNFFNLLIAN